MLVINYVIFRKLFWFPSTFIYCSFLTPQTLESIRVVLRIVPFFNCELMTSIYTHLQLVLS